MPAEGTAGLSAAMRRGAPPVIRTCPPFALPLAALFVLWPTLVSAEPRSGSGSPAELSDRPNIVLILADDLGWGSVGAYGADRSLVRTPSIDQLAAEGVAFRNAYTPSSVCSPTRYAILTGRYSWRTELKWGALSIHSPLLPDPAEPTIASVLQRTGYATAFIGKWHLGFGNRPRLDYKRGLDPGPLELGFDYFYGLSSNHGDLTGVYTENHAVAGLRSGRTLPAAEAGTNFQGKPYLGLDAPRRVDEEVMDVFTERAIDWLGRQGPERPFFLYFSLVAVHRPVTPSSATAGTSAAGVYGDWIHEADRAVGRVLEALSESGVADRTLVLFTSDNGGVVEDKPKLDASVARERGLEVNGPYRGGKRSVYDGGFRVPLVARWPGSAPAGSTREEMVSLVDLFATLAELVGTDRLPPSSWSGRDSVTFLPALLGRRMESPRASLVLHSHDGNFAIRWGRWKWIEGVPEPGWKKSQGQNEDADAIEHVPQLYDLESDPSESRNLVSDYPAVERHLSRLLTLAREEG